ncbi:MAG: site-2 protease family protein [Oscillospiraceae bacterium]|jgi:regulator of sigma E protease|nr:site-2 protease family protein [Oscillospiraceae bacterium]
MLDRIIFIIIGIVIFGILIAIHELGHFLAAKRLGVKVNEFAIGMGPKIWSKQKGETLYALRLLPIGGSCMMEGEDAEVPDPRAFTAAKRWRRVVILAAGAFFNFLLGVLIVLILSFITSSFAGTTITALAPGFPDNGAQGLQVGDKMVSINGERLYYRDDFSMFMALPAAADGVVDMVVLRDGQRVTLKDYAFAPREYTEYGVTSVRYGITLNSLEPTFGEKLRYAGYTTFNYVRMVRIGLVQLVSGGAGVKDLSGPVGIVTAITDVGADKRVPFGDRLATAANFGALIAINLAIMNLLPIPALDGGRIFALIVTFFIEKITRKRVNPKYEGYVHAAGMVLLLGLMAVVMFNDIVKLVTK